MLRRELELQAKALGIRGYSSMRMTDLVARVDDETASAPVNVVDSGPVEVKLIEQRSPVTHQCRHCKSAFDESEMFMSARVKEEHGIEVWFCRNTQACTVRVSE